MDGIPKFNPRSDAIKHHDEPGEDPRGGEAVSIAARIKEARAAVKRLRKYIVVVRRVKP